MSLLPAQRLASATAAASRPPTLPPIMTGTSAPTAFSFLSAFAQTAFASAIAAGVCNQATGLNYEQTARRLSKTMTLCDHNGAMHVKLFVMFQTSTSNYDRLM